MSRSNKEDKKLMKHKLVNFDVVWLSVIAGELCGFS